MKIGELAEMTGITKRTIDYYTNLGLLKAERSTSNYRFYSPEAIERIKVIEQMKVQGMCLHDIKQYLHEQNDEIDLQNIRLQMKTLQKEISLLVESMEKQEQSNNRLIKNKVSSESIALMQSLLLLIT